MKSRRLVVERLLGQLVIAAFCARAGPAEYSTVATDFTAEINSFPANLTHNPVTLVSRKLFWRQFHFYPLRRKYIVIRNFAICRHLLLILILNFRMYLARQSS